MTIAGLARLGWHGWIWLAIEKIALGATNILIPALGLLQSRRGKRSNDCFYNRLKLLRKVLKVLY